MQRHQPETAKDAAALIASASAPLELQGNGTKAGVANACTARDILCLAGLNGINFYEPRELVISVQAGTPLSVINAALAESNQRLAFEPPTYGALFANPDADPTAGGLVATNLSGPARVSRGALRDHLLGVEFINGRGVQIKSGGRVMKNVTGYDVCKLLAGSWGTLGALTAVTLKTLPKMETEATLMLCCDEVETAGRLMRRAMMTPFDVLSTAYVRGVIAVRVEGLQPSVDYRFGALQTLLSDEIPGAKQTRLDGGRSVLFWQGVREVESTLDHKDRVWKISVAPRDGPALVQALKADDRNRTRDGTENRTGGGEIRSYMLDWSGGLVWVGEAQGTGAALLDLCEPWIRGGAGGHIKLIKGKSPLSGTRPNKLQGLLETKIKLAFDPAGILSPNRI